MKFYADATCSLWPVAYPWIVDACDHGDGWWTPQAIAELLANGRAVLWILADDDGSPKAAIVSAVANWDGKKVAECIAQGGEGVNAALSDHLEQVEAWARTQGADEMYFRGRRGLSRVYKSFGYDEIAVTLRKVL